MSQARPRLLLGFVVCCCTRQGLATEASSVAARLLVDGKWVSRWTVHDHFSLEVTGPNLDGDAHIVLLERVGGVGNTDCAGARESHPSLQGSLAANATDVEDLEGEVVRWQFRDLRIVRGGVFAVCWCDRGNASNSSCVSQGTFTVAGPHLLQDGQGRPLANGTDGGEGSPYVLEAFSLEVVGTQLTLDDRARIVDGTVACGGAGAALQTEALQGPLAEALPRQDVGNLTTSGSESSMTFTGLSLTQAGLFRVCWCMANRSLEYVDANYTYDHLGRSTSTTSTSTSGTITSTSSVTVTTSTLSSTTSTTSTSSSSTETHSTTSTRTDTSLTETSTTFTSSMTVSTTTAATLSATELQSSTESSTQTRTASGTATATRTSTVSSTLTQTSLTLTSSSTGTTPTSTTTTSSSATTATQSSTVTSLTSTRTSTSTATTRTDTSSSTVTSATQVTIASTSTASTATDTTSTSSTLTVEALCNDDSMFDVDAGNFLVAGPTDLRIVQADGAPTAAAWLERNFTLEILGRGLGNGSQRIRVVPEGTACGGPGASQHSPLLRGPLAEEADLEGAGERPDSAQAWAALRLVQEEAQYRVCWCSGRSGAACDEDGDFSVTAGSFKAEWLTLDAEHVNNVTAGIFGDDEEPLRPVVNLSFALVIRGERLQSTSRVRVVPAATICGSYDAIDNTDALLGSLSKVPDSPGSLDGSAQALRWPELRLSRGGTYRVCWCSGLLSGCRSFFDFHTDVGEFEALEVTRAWPEPCTRAGSPFRFHIAGLGLLPQVDRVLLAYGSESCGEALPRALSPGGQVAHLFGFATLTCSEDPNAGAVLGERKLVCGDGAGAIIVSSPGWYRVCLCGRTAQFDCADAADYRVPVGEAFTVAAALADVSEWNFTVSTGYMSPPPMVLSSPGPVRAIAYAPAAAPGAAEPPRRLLAAAAEDGAVRLWEPGAPRLASTLVGHTDQVHALAWAPDGTWLVSGGFDQALRKWPSTSGQLPNHACPLWEPVWDRPDGQASDDVWQDIVLGHILGIEPENVSSVPLADSQTAVSAEDLSDWQDLTLRRASVQCEKACSRYRERAAPLCNCGPTLECHLLHRCVPRCGLESYVWELAHDERITALAVSADGALIASAAMDHSVRLWDAVEAEPLPLATVTTHTRGVLCIAFAPGTLHGGHVLATGGDDGLVLLLNITGVIAALGPPTEMRRFQWSLPVQALAFSATGRWFAMATALNCSLWDTESFEQLREWAVNETADAHAAVAGLAFADDDAWLAHRGPESVQVWPLNDSISIANAGFGEWVRLAGSDFASAQFSWAVSDTPETSLSHDIIFAENGSVLELHFTPCTEGCDDVLPTIRLDVELDFEFTAVRGSFVEYSLGPQVADDCSWGAPHSSWDDDSALTHYFATIASRSKAHGADCERVGPTGIVSHESLAACEEACLAQDGLCNLINYRDSPRGCDLRRCINASQPQLASKDDTIVRALVLRREAEEQLRSPHDGYVMFGAPSVGDAGVLYGGCSPGPIPSDGAQIIVEEQQVGPTRVLRWQVAQSQPGEGVGIRGIALELYRPSHWSRRVAAGGAASPAVALAPGLRELASTTGPEGLLTVWDLHGLDIPPGKHDFVELRSFLSISLEAPRLQAEDEIRIVPSSVTCGGARSAESSRAVWGLGDGRRSSGNGTSSRWEGIVVMLSGDYRVCFCKSGPHTCCDKDADFINQLQTFVVSGVDDDHYGICEVPTDIILVERICKLEGFSGVGLQEGDMLMMQDTLICGTDAAKVEGLENGGVMVSRVPDPWEDLGQWEEGSWYRLEQKLSYTAVSGDALYTPVSPMVTGPGLTARLCWCGASMGCDPDSPSDFKFDAGLVVLLKITREPDPACNMQAPCEVQVSLLDNQPIAVGDQLVVKTGSKPSQRLACGGDVVQGLGPNEDGFSGRMEASGNGTDWGVFDLGYTLVSVGSYRLCWCQASTRPCTLAEDFVFDIGALLVQDALGGYTWPDCMYQPLDFEEWRQWTTFDDCCCNYAEAGAYGCQDEGSVAYATCSPLPRR